MLKLLCEKLTPYIYAPLSSFFSAVVRDATTAVPLLAAVPATLLDPVTFCLLLKYSSASGASSSSSSSISSSQSALAAGVATWAGVYAAYCGFGGEGAAY